MEYEYIQEMVMQVELLQIKFRSVWLELMFQFQFQWPSIALGDGKDLYLEIVECMEWKE